MPTDALTAPATPDEQVGVIKQTWRDGAPPDAIGALREYPELLKRKTLVIDLAYEEYCLREEAGRTPDAELFCRDLPAFRSDVREVIRGHRALADHPELFDLADIRWPEPGEAFEGFTIVRELGRGAFARAYLAADPDTGNRPVVLKISPTPSGEARTLGPIRHPHVAEVLWARRANGLSAICMRYVGAATLRDAVAAAFDAPANKSPTARTVLEAIDKAGSSLPQADPVPSLLRPNASYADAVATIGARLAEALAALHGRGVTHGDLKPSNILLGAGGHPYLIDFNLAGEAGESLHHRGGTLPYMAPERIRLLLGQSAEAGLDGQSDVYSFGAVLFEALTGQVPFEPIDCPDLNDVAADLLTRQLAGRSRLVAAGVPRALARLVDECLSAEPARRPSAETLQRRLVRFVRRRTRRGRILMVAAVAVAGSTIGWVGMRTPAVVEASPVAAAAPAPVPVAPTTADEFIARGFELLARGDHDRAFADFTAAFQRRQEGRSLALMGYCRTRGGNHKQAVGFYWQAIKEFGYREAWAHSNRAYGMIRNAVNSLTQLGTALDELEVALEIDSDLPAARFNRAYCRFFKELDRKSWILTDPVALNQINADLELFLKERPPAPDLYFLAAQVLAASGSGNETRLRQAVAHLRTAVEHGYPVEQLAKDPVFSKWLSGRDDFREVLRLPASPRPSAAVNLALADPPAR